MTSPDVFDEPRAVEVQVSFRGPQNVDVPELVLAECRTEQCRHWCIVHPYHKVALDFPNVSLSGTGGASSSSSLPPAWSACSSDSSRRQRVESLALVIPEDLQRHHRSHGQLIDHPRFSCKDIMH